MSERGEWFVCLVSEGAVRALIKQAVESGASTVWLKSVSWRPGVEKVIVRWDRPVTEQYIKRLMTAAYSVARWRGEVEYQASQETRVATIEKLKREYRRCYSKYSKEHPHFRFNTDKAIY